jgi:hypothetical protein
MDEKEGKENLTTKTIKNLRKVDQKKSFFSFFSFLSCFISRRFLRAAKTEEKSFPHFPALTPSLSFISVFVFSFQRKDGKTMKSIIREKNTTRTRNFFRFFEGRQKGGKVFFLSQCDCDKLQGN